MLVEVELENEEVLLSGIKLEVESRGYVRSKKLERREWAQKSVIRKGAVDSRFVL